MRDTFDRIPSRKHLNQKYIAKHTLVEECFEVVYRDRQRYHIFTVRTSPTHTAVLASAGQYLARVSAAHWSQDRYYSGSFQRVCRVAASRQSHVCHQTQSPDPRINHENCKSYSHIAHILTGRRLRSFGSTKWRCECCSNVRYGCRNNLSGSKSPNTAIPRVIRRISSL